MSPSNVSYRAVARIPGSDRVRQNNTHIRASHDKWIEEMYEASPPGTVIDAYEAVEIHVKSITKPEK